MVDGGRRACRGRAGRRRRGRSTPTWRSATASWPWGRGPRRRTARRGRSGRPSGRRPARLPVSRFASTANTTAATMITPTTRTAQPAVAPGRRRPDGGVVSGGPGGEDAGEEPAGAPPPAGCWVGALDAAIARPHRRRAGRRRPAVVVVRDRGSSRVRSTTGAMPAVASSACTPATTDDSCLRTSARLGRSRGSLASIACRTGASAPARLTGRGSSLTTAWTVEMGRSRRNGGSPSTATYSVAPSDHRSVAGLASSPRTCSGETKSGVPSASPDMVSAEVSPVTEAIPKSVTSAPSGETSTLLGLTSRWTMPASWAASSAARTSSPSSAARCGDSGPSRSTISCSDGASTNSMTMWMASSSLRTS